MMGSQNSPLEPVKLGDGSPSFTHARLQSCWKAIFHILRHASYRWSAPSETVHMHTHTHLAVIRRIVPPLILWPDMLGTRGLFACFASTASGEQHLNKVQTEAGCCPIRGQPRQSGWAEQRCSAKKKTKKGDGCETPRMALRFRSFGAHTELFFVVVSTPTAGPVIAATKDCRSSHNNQKLQALSSHTRAHKKRKTSAQRAGSCSVVFVPARGT